MTYEATSENLVDYPFKYREIDLTFARAQLKQEDCADESAPLPVQI